MGIRIKAETEEGEQLNQYQETFYHSQVSGKSSLNLSCLSSGRKGCVHTATSSIGKAENSVVAESRNFGKRESEDGYSKWKDSKKQGREVICVQLRTVPGTSQTTKNS